MLSCYDTPFAECLGKAYGDTCAPGKRCWFWPNLCAAVRDGGYWEYGYVPAPMTCQDVPSEDDAGDGGGSSGEPLALDAGPDGSVGAQAGDASVPPVDAGDDAAAPIASDAGCSLGGESGGLNAAALLGLAASAAALVARWRRRRKRS